jgi:ABC-2 type transport system ATP-binding protein
MHIALEGATKAYGPLRALDGLTLEIDPGQVVALLGPNGAGKTTLLRCLAGVAALDSGVIRFDGETFRRGRVDLRRRLGFLPEFPFVYPEMTVLRHMGMTLRLYGADPLGVEEWAIRLLRDFDLLALAELPLGTLSRGQAYKAALATLIAVDPEVWLLDEPFASGMDPDGIIALKSLARKAAERGRTVLYSTQILAIAESFCDRACVIDRGQARAYGRLNDLAGPDADKGEILESLFRRLREERR